MSDHGPHATYQPQDAWLARGSETSIEGRHGRGAPTGSIRRLAAGEPSHPRVFRGANAPLVTQDSGVGGTIDLGLILAFIAAPLLVLVPLGHPHDYQYALAAAGWITAGGIVAAWLGEGPFDVLWEPMLLVFFSFVPVFFIWIGAGNLDAQHSMRLAIAAAGLSAVAFHALWWRHRYPWDELPVAEDLEGTDHVRWGLKKSLLSALGTFVYVIVLLVVLVAIWFVEGRSIDVVKIGLLLSVVALTYAAIGVAVGYLLGKLKPLATTPVRLVAIGFILATVAYMLCIPAVVILKQLEGEAMSPGRPFTLLLGGILCGGMVGPPVAVARSLGSAEKSAPE